MIAHDRRAGADVPAHAAPAHDQAGDEGRAQADRRLARAQGAAPPPPARDGAQLGARARSPRRPWCSPTRPISRSPCATGRARTRRRSSSPRAAAPPPRRSASWPPSMRCRCCLPAAHPRALLHDAAPARSIREDLYMAVATVLAFVFNLDAALAVRAAQPEVEVPAGLRFDAQRPARGLSRAPSSPLSAASEEVRTGDADAVDDRERPSASAVTLGRDRAADLLRRSRSRVGARTCPAALARAARRSSCATRARAAGAGPPSPGWMRSDPGMSLRRAGPSRRQRAAGYLKS